MILVDAVNSSNNSIKTYNILSQTCSRFKKKTCTSHMKFLDSVFDSFRRFYDKIKVSLWKVMKKFDPETGVPTSLTEIFDDKKWRSTWVAINPGKHSWYSWYMIKRCYWKLNESQSVWGEKKLYWLKNDLCHFHFEDKEILRSPTTWLNDRIMDAAQKFVCN